MPPWLSSGCLEELERFETACRIAQLDRHPLALTVLIQAILINNRDIVRREQEAIPKENSQGKEKSGALYWGAAYYGGGKDIWI